MMGIELQGPIDEALQLGKILHLRTHSTALRFSAEIQEQRVVGVRKARIDGDRLVRQRDAMIIGGVPAALELVSLSIRCKGLLRESLSLFLASGGCFAERG